MKFKDRCTKGECRVKIEIMLPQGKALVKARREAKKRSFPHKFLPLEETNPANTMISDFYPPELRQKFLFMPSSLWLPQP